MAASAAPRICILGSEVSALAAAFFLRRRIPTAQITLIAAKPRSQIRTTRGRFHFEEGLRDNVLNSRSGRELLGLCRLLELDNQVISGDLVASARRHVFLGGRVQYFPRVWHVFRYGLWFMLEPLWLRRRSSEGESATESVASFCRRRFSESVRRDLAEPLTWGLCGLSTKSASIKWCFPRVFHNEQTFGSIFWGAFRELFRVYRNKSWLCLKMFDPLNARISNGGRIFSFRDGMDVLPNALLRKIQSGKLEMSRIPVNVITDADVKTIRVGSVEDSSMDLKEPSIPLQSSSTPSSSSSSSSSNAPAAVVSLTDGRIIPADCVISALPSFELASKVESSYPDLASILQKIQHQRVAVVNLGYENLKVKLRAASYVCPPEEPVFSVSLHSKAFPEHNKDDEECRIAVHLPIRDGFDSTDTAKKTLERHLGITEEPDEVSVQEYSLAMYVENHDAVLQELEQNLMPWLKVIGPSFRGLSVADEVVDTRMVTDSLCFDEKPSSPPKPRNRVVVQTH